MKLRLFPLLGLLIVVSLLIQGAPLPAAARTESAPAVPTAFCDSVTEIPKTECEALVALYNSTNGPGWSNRNGWLVTNAPCSWYGVTCSQGHVQQLALGDNSLQGSIPPQLGNLTGLQWLTLASNKLSGTIPRELGNLTRLPGLYLHNNQLSGNIPPELGRLVNLQQLFLYNNQLTGAIPPELGNLSSLTGLDLSTNQLTGSIPPQLSNLGKLEWLSLASNKLSGGIPLELGSLPNLTSVLNLSTNQLTGVIPPQLGNLTRLGWLSLGSNKLNGSIPLELGNLTRLSALYLYNNQLSGSIPSQLGSLVNLQSLYLYSNQLTGAIPPQLGSLATLQYLYLDGNQLTGVIPPQLGNLTRLQYLSLSKNQLTGVIPPQLSSLANLRTFYLDNNQLTGAIPSWLGSLVNLQYLHLHENQLTGVIPPQLGNLTKLERLILYNNQLSGNIPPELGRLVNLQWFYLYGNQLNGDIPPELGNLSNLTHWELARNQLTGSIPPQLGNLAKLWELGLSGNQLTGAIPTELGNLANLQSLDMSSNQLTGAIPPQLGNLANLWGLYLDSNQLTGAIPPQLGSLANLHGLGLDRNQLTGVIPVWLGNLADLQYLVLSSNQLTGAIPPQLGNLADLQYLVLSSNQLTGAIPPQLGSLSTLQWLGLDRNQLTGVIPAWLGNLSTMQGLDLGANQLIGTIPPQLGNLANLQYLVLSSNQLTGAIPPQLGNLAKLTTFSLANNALEGEIPATLVSLTNLNTNSYDRTDFGFNKLVASNPSVIALLNTKDPDWAQTQTVPPADSQAVVRSGNTIELTWTPVPYTSDGGHYEVGYSATPGGPYSIHGRTGNKRASNYTVSNLLPGRTYYFAVRTYTPAHGDQQNNLLSGWSQEVSATTLLPTIAHIEITQATQNEGNTVPLIAGKPTFVRVYVDCGEGCSVLPGMTGVLRGYGPSGELSGSPRSPTGFQTGITAYHESWQSQRGNLGKTLNFTLPQEWLSGTVTLRAEVTGASHSEQFMFVDARQPNIIYVPVRFADAEPSSRIDDAFSWAQKVWPSAGINYLRWPAMDWSPPLLCYVQPVAKCPSLSGETNDERYTRCVQGCFRADLKTKLTELYWQGHVGGYIFGWLANGAENQLGVWGSSDPAWNGGYGKAAFGVDHPTDGPQIFTHEVAHLMSRRHPNTPDSCVPGVDSKSDWPPEYGNARIQQWGLDGYGFGWLIGSASALKDPVTTYDYMSYCWVHNYGGKPTWTSPWTFQRIYEQTLRPTASTFVSQPLAEPTPYLMVSGLVFSNTTAVLNPVWIITPTLAPDGPPAGVGYCLEAEDSTAATLASRCFDLVFMDYDTGAPTNVKGFNLALPYSPSVKRLVLKKGATELAVRTVSAHAPAVTVLSPNGGETWAASGTYTITWTASDLDGDPLTYSVLYSPDGDNWVPVGTAITGTQLAVNAAELAGGTAARVRVLATDGVNTSSDESDATFTVGRKGPSAFILVPMGDVRFMPGTPLWLQGYGYDLEDGTLAGAALRWHSNRDGDLGTGSQTLVTLSSGPHVVTLTATDKDGNTVTTSINVYAGGEIYLPLSLRGQ